jgi:hypothetical protein
MEHNQENLYAFKEVVYQPCRDGTIQEYFEHCEGERLPACFFGLEQFKELTELGYILPYVTKIRIMYSSGRWDECYLVIKDFQLEGIEMEAHSGKKGIHKPEDILTADCPHYEVHDRNRNPQDKETIAEMNNLL